VDLVFAFGWQILIMKGAENIMPYKLSPTTGTVRFYAKCCGSSMCEHGPMAFAFPAETVVGQPPKLDGRIMLQKDAALHEALDNATPKVPGGDDFTGGTTCSLLGGLCWTSCCPCFTCRCGTGNANPPAPFNIKPEAVTEVLGANPVVQSATAEPKAL
jgi:hypothetical protein